MKITIITPTIGRTTLLDTIKSVLEQDYTDIEHLIIPDTNKYKDFGHSVRQDAIWNATGDYITYMDDDDSYIGVDAISTMVKGIKENNCPTFLFFPCLRFGEKFFNDPKQGQLVTSIQYAHKRIDDGGELIQFTGGDIYNHDNDWIQQMMSKYDRVMYDCRELVRVDVSNRGV